jgi:outer membrane protein W
MRSSRLVVLLLAAAAAVGLTPSAGAAQSDSRDFTDSWYWGAYGGFTNFATAFGSQNVHTNAPSIGADWMLTRTNFALNIFADQSYFSTVSSIASPTGAGPLGVNINDMRRVGFAFMMFPHDFRAFKPYVGLGYSFNFINSAALRSCSGCGTFPTQAAADSNQQAITDARAMGKVFGNVGVMYIYKRFAPFVQAAVMPTQGASDWFLNGTGFTTIWAVGLRYNFGSSIEKW